MFFGAVLLLAAVALAVLLWRMNRFERADLRREMADAAHAAKLGHN